MRVNRECFPIPWSEQVFRLELSETERQDTIRRHNEVRECIRAKFDIDRDFLTGSYARHTKTKPLKDVDIFFVLSER
ncbi:MAG: hypothetical protein HC915_10075, partial [Anaerolineae bacterium]|nr:hypothetical protein [Anaerolineae bacterium]